MKSGLVLEGGGMRGLYTIGVLEYFYENGINFDYLIGVSAGACNGISFASNQPYRNFRVNTEYISDKRYLSFSNLIKTKSLFGMDFIFNEIPEKYDLFDYEAFFKSNQEFITGVTDVVTGKPSYFGKEVYRNHNTTILRASSSIPVFSPVVEYNGGKYLDGGTSDPIPVKKAFEDGCDKVVVVLTRERDFTKTPESFRNVYKHVLKNYPNMIKVLDNRHKVYNETREYLFELEKSGKAIVIAPSEPIKVSRFEKSIDVLKEVHTLGRKDARDKLSELSEFKVEK